MFNKTKLFVPSIFLPAIFVPSIFVPAIFLLVALSSPIANAQFTITAPNNDTVTACDDYFTTKWSDPLDMNGTTPFQFGDVLDNLLNLGSEYQDLGAVSYADGLATMTAVGLVPFFRVLTPTSAGEIVDSYTSRYGRIHPINSSTYSLLSFRMWSSANSFYSIRWDRSDGASALTTLQNTYAGWHTYQVDLNSATIGSGEPAWNSGEHIGLGIFPARNLIGTQVKFDWIQLTPASCPTFNTTYTATSGKVVSFFVDDNSDPTDGYLERTEPAVATGSSTNVTLESDHFFPETYNVLGLDYDDFYTQHFAPVDMASSADIVSDSIVQITGTSFAGGEFCGTTTGTDPSFRLSQPGASALIDSDLFRYLTFSISGLNAGNTMQIIFFDENLSPIGARDKVFTVDGVYTVDMEDQSGTNVGAWQGQIGAIRFDPGIQNGRSFCVDWIRLGSTAVTTAPVLPAFTSAPGTITIGGRESAYFKMPDIEGGRDWFTHVKTNPANFSSSSDWSLLLNQQNVTLYPGNQYFDNKGDAFNGDYLQSQNLQSGGAADGDTQVFMVLRQTANPINAALYKRACVTLVIPDVDVDDDHTVLRYGWEDAALNGYTSDDIILKTNGRGRYCADLSVAAIEEGGVSKTGDYWANPAQDFKIVSFRIDGHERDDTTTLIIDDVRLAADHEAGDQFAIVVGGDRTESVAIYKNTLNSTTGGTLIGTLSANRSSDVLLWDTSLEANGTVYYLYATVSGRSFLSRAPVVINNDYDDSTAPVLSVAAPLLDGSGRYATLDVAGYAVDGIRLAIIEGHIDGELVLSFLPEDFRLAARNLHPEKPYTSNSGFQKSVDLSNFADGAHTFTLTAYDTAGNTTVYSAAFTKASTSLSAPISYDTPDETPETIDVSNPGQNLKLSVKKNLTAGTVTFAIKNAVDCSTLRLIAGSSKSDVQNRTNTTEILSFTNSKATRTFQASKMRPFKSKTYFGAECNGAWLTTVKGLSAKKFIGKPLKNVTKFLSFVKKKTKEK